MNEDMILKARVHSTESFGAADGPGVRFLVFLKGCPLRCRYCHNPDTWYLGEGSEMSVSQILNKAERYRSYWGEEGGITVSGGEPLLQIDFLLELFTEAKKRNIHTCIDTSAAPFTFEEPFFSKFEALMKVTDLLLLDIKHIDNEKHKELTGKENTNILSCASYLSEIHKSVWIRHVLVPEWTDKDEYLTRLRDFLDTLTNVERVDVLPYHTLGVFKWETLGLPYGLEGIDPPSEERILNAKKILKDSRVKISPKGKKNETDIRMC